MSPLRRFLLMLALTAMWSPSFLFIKLAVQGIPPMTVAASRITLAAVIFCVILFWKGYRLPLSPVFWMHAILVGLFSSAFPFCLFCYAEQTIDSALAAILNGTTPMFTALLAQLFIPSDRLTISKGIGIACCAMGLVVLFAPNVMEGMHGSFHGMLAGAMAAFCYSVHHVYSKKYITGLQPYVVPAASLTVSALILWPLTFYYENPYTLSVPSLSSILGVCGLAFFGTVCAFIIYYRLIEECGPTAISLVACFFPVGGILLGVLFLGEKFSYTHLLAAVLILLGMGIVNQVIPLKFIRRLNQRQNALHLNLNSRNHPFD